MSDDWRRPISSPTMSLREYLVLMQTRADAGDRQAERDLATWKRIIDTSSVWLSVFPADAPAGGAQRPSPAPGVAGPHTLLPDPFEEF